MKQYKKIAHFCLWGRHPLMYGNEWVILSKGALAEMQAETKIRSMDERWSLTTLRVGQTPSVVVE